jgi:hydrogenase maturation factor
MHEKINPGKLDHDFLDYLLKKYTMRDDRVIVGSAVGEDAAVIDMGDRYLLAKTDPITFVTDQIGYYAVHVNVNDIVCMGGRPLWFLSTVLLPKNADKGQTESIFQQIHETCRKEGITLCGGHTEVVCDLIRPVVVGQMLGEVEKDRLLKKENAREDDRLVLANGIPIEATSIIAREKSRELSELYAEDFVERCKALLYDPGISVRRAASIALENGDVRAMHDPTEGGLATALFELASAADLGIRVTFEDIPFVPEGKLLCDQFDLNPLGCISSGALLIVVSPESSNSIVSALLAADIPAADIGRMVSRDEGKILEIDAKKYRLPLFSQDEIIKIF